MSGESQRNEENVPHFFSPCWQLWFCPNSTYRCHLSYDVACAKMASIFWRYVLHVESLNYAPSIEGLCPINWGLMSLQCRVYVPPVQGLCPIHWGSMTNPLRVYIPLINGLCPNPLRIHVSPIEGLCSTHRRLALPPNELCPIIILLPINIYCRWCTESMFLIGLYRDLNYA